MSDASVGVSLEDLWTARAATASASDAVYGTLREAIMSRRLRPGDRLSELHLARQFGVSRTPIREAILRLEAEELAQRIPRRGLMVRGIPEEEVLEVYTVRGVLDGLAARLAATRALPSNLTELRWINQRLGKAADAHDVSAMAELNIEFHEALCRAARNRMLLRFAQQIHDWVRRFETTFAHPGRGHRSVAEHDQILTAIESGAADEAERLARAHMSHSREFRITTLRGGPPETDLPPPGERG